ncbi:G2/M phase-specific E3 ubiquitin-protein ligase-like isoform X2 [Neoarius graeffei]|nr:G2/M phase-specific E3 ubiquitin-protein ligase-like isoform X2 [Neoarius graeffei]
MAGRMIGHSVIHGGPTLSGLSPAVVDALIYSTKEMAASKLCMEDCSDVEHRETISLVMKERWTEEESSQIRELCLNWYCPVLTNETNRLLLFQQLLSHAVLGRAHAQIKQIRKGLKDTGVWPLLATRQDVVPLFFPREAEVQLTPEVILQCIRWPHAKEANSDDSDDDVPTGTVSAITGYFRTFIENATSGILSKLVKFWTGWEVPPSTLNIEIVKSRGRNHLLTASTCYERLRIPDHYCSYSGLKSDLMVCVESVDSGFGLV